MYTIVRVIGYGIGMLSLNGSLSTATQILNDNGLRVQELHNIDENTFLFMCDSGHESTDLSIRQFSDEEIEIFKSCVALHGTQTFKSRFALIFK